MPGTVARLMAVLLLHGWNGSGPGHWQRWLEDRLRTAGIAVRFPDLPACAQPCPDAWGAALHAELDALGPGDHVVVCHSLACVLWVREAGLVTHPVGRVLLVAPPGPDAGVPELEGFYPALGHAGALRAAAATTRLVCADDDPYCPGGAAAVWGEPLDLPVDLHPGQGHLNVEAGYGPWPEVEAWVLGQAATVPARAAAAAAGQGPPFLTAGR
jgi:predicted alpha/beta hydrolase family esterase